jgi:hypothetical protein
MLEALKIDMTKPGGASVVWDGKVSGMDNLVQKASVNCVTEIGSDWSAPKRGFDLFPRMASTNVMDPMGVQHLLNFSAVKTRNDLANAVSSKDPVDIPAQILLLLVEVSGGHVSANMIVENAAGDKTTETKII